MIDRDKIPEPLYSQLIEFFGHERAEEIIDQAQYNIRSIHNRIIHEKLKQRFGEKYWIYLLIFCSAIAAIYEILSWKMII